MEEQVEYVWCERANRVHAGFASIVGELIQLSLQIRFSIFELLHLRVSIVDDHDALRNTGGRIKGCGAGLCDLSLNLGDLLVG
jgi:hypothetical protein